MRFCKVNTGFALFVVVMLLMCVPQFSYAAQYASGDSSDDYEYVDQYGHIIEDNYRPEESVDTSWFDSTNPKKEYHLNTKAELLGFASLVNEIQPTWKENAHENFKGVTIFLERNIKLTSEWNPIGDGEKINFSGTFDGQGHTISGLRINSNYINVGFFGYLPGKVCNLKLAGSVTSTNGPCGAFAGELAESGRIRNCGTNVTIKGKAKTGGIAGYNNGGRVSLCTSNGDVSGIRDVGGVVGENWGDITECINNGNVRSTDRGTGTYGTGGIAGRTVNGRTLDQCYNRGNIVSFNEATGGVAGYTTAVGTRITASSNSGNITVKNPDKGKSAAGMQKGEEIFHSCAGGVVGIVGGDDVEIRHCYSAGRITGADVKGTIVGTSMNVAGETNTHKGYKLQRWQQYLAENMKTNDMIKAKAMLPMYKDLYVFEKKCPDAERKGNMFLRGLLIMYR